MIKKFNITSACVAVVTIYTWHSESPDRTENIVYNTVFKVKYSINTLVKPDKTENSVNRSIVRLD